MPALCQEDVAYAAVPSQSHQWCCDCLAVVRGRHHESLKLNSGGILVLTQGEFNLQVPCFSIRVGSSVLDVFHSGPSLAQEKSYFSLPSDQ